MGTKGAGRAGDFAERVIAEIERARRDAGMTKAALISDSGMGANTFHKKMRGEVPFNLNEIQSLAEAMQLDPILLLQRASSVGGASDDSYEVTLEAPRREDVALVARRGRRKGRQDDGDEGAS